MNNSREALKSRHVYHKISPKRLPLGEVGEFLKEYQPPAYIWPQLIQTNNEQIFNKWVGSSHVHIYYPRNNKHIPNKYELGTSSTARQASLMTDIAIQRKNS